MLVTGRNLWLVVVLATIAIFFVTETSSAAGRLKLNKNGHKKVNGSEIQPKGRNLKYKGRKAANSEKAHGDFSGRKKEFNSEKPKIIRVPLLSYRERRSIDTRDETINENERNGYGSKFARNATVLSERSSYANNFSASASKIAKKNYKKLKLAQIRSKNPKNKEYSDDRDFGKYADKRSAKKEVVRRPLVSVVDKEEDSYYIKRREIMDRFYARQQEIDKEYANRISTTARSTDKYDLGIQKSIDEKLQNENTISPVKIQLENVYEKEKEPNGSANITSEVSHVDSVTEAERYPRKKRDENDFRADANSKVYRWGSCSTNQLIYQHNFFLGVYKSTTTEMSVTTSIESTYCLDCVTVEFLTISKAMKEVIPEKNGNVYSVKITAKGFQDEQLPFIVKMFVVKKVGNRC